MANSTLTNSQLLGLSNAWRTSQEEVKAKYTTSHLTHIDNSASSDATEPISSYTY